MWQDGRPNEEGLYEFEGVRRLTFSQDEYTHTIVRVASRYINPAMVLVVLLHGRPKYYHLADFRGKWRKVNLEEEK